MRRNVRLFLSVNVRVFFNVKTLKQMTGEHAYVYIVKILSLKFKHWMIWTYSHELVWKTTFLKISYQTFFGKPVYLIQ